MGFVSQYLQEVREVAARLDPAEVERLVELLVSVAGQGRLFILGIGGSAANASHAVNDFRTLAGFEAYTPTDNVAELTARINDDEWESVYAAWLRASHLTDHDGVLILSVGGGDEVRGVSVPLIHAIRYAKEIGASVGAIVGRDGGYAAFGADVCVIVPTVNPAHVTVHTEAFQAVLWHLLVSHPRLRTTSPKWESVDETLR